MANDIKGLLFDKDGTLFDFGATWGSWAAHFFRTLTTTEAEAARLGRVLGYDLATGDFAKDSVIIAGTPGEIARAIHSHLPDRTQAGIIEIANETAASAPQAEVTPLKPFFETMRRSGYRIGVSTNDGEAPARSHLEQAGILHLFDFVAGYDSGFGGKPAPGMQRAFCEQQTLPPQNVAMIGDSTHDLLAGRAAGMRTVGVLTGPASREDLAPLADVVLHSIADLPEWLGLSE